MDKIRTSYFLFRFIVLPLALFTRYRFNFISDWGYPSDIKFLSFTRYRFHFISDWSPFIRECWLCICGILLLLLITFQGINFCFRQFRFHFISDSTVYTSSKAYGIGFVPLSERFQIRYQANRTGAFSCKQKANEA